MGYYSRWACFGRQKTHPVFAGFSCQMVKNRYKGRYCVVGRYRLFVAEVIFARIPHEMVKLVQNRWQRSILTDQSILIIPMKRFLNMIDLKRNRFIDRCCWLCDFINLLISYMSALLRHFHDN